MLNGKLRMEDGPSWSSLSVSNLRWNWLWKINVPPKVQTFLWRACHEIIPSRHIGTNPFCGFCKVEIETGAH